MPDIKILEHGDVIKTSTYVEVRKLQDLAITAKSMKLMLLHSVFVYLFIFCGFFQVFAVLSETKQS